MLEDWRFRPPWCTKKWKLCHRLLGRSTFVEETQALSFANYRHFFNGGMSMSTAQKMMYFDSLTQEFISALFSFFCLSFNVQKLFNVCQLAENSNRGPNILFLEILTLKRDFVVGLTPPQKDTFLCHRSCKSVAHRSVRMFMKKVRQSIVQQPDKLRWDKVR